MIHRNTFQRSAVLNAVQQLKCHATADEIYENVREICPSISRTTVYRNLQQLCGSGEIQKIEIPGSPDRFDHVTESHYHMRCLSCGRVFDADMDYMPDLGSRILDAHGFLVTAHSIVFTGKCAECQTKGN